MNLEDITRIWKGVIVEGDKNVSNLSESKDGLYLLTDEDEQFALSLDPRDVGYDIGWEDLHARSRVLYEDYLGRKVRIQGYLHGSTIFAAIVI